MTEEFRDIICHVLAPTCSENIIYHVLDKYIPNRETLNLEYAAHLDGKRFQSERDMVRHFINRDYSGRTFYWKSETETPDNLMVGADITSDKRLIMSLTLDGTEQRANAYLVELKSVLKSNAGVISHTIPAPYETGQDFQKKYGGLN